MSQEFPNKIMVWVKRWKPVIVFVLLILGGIASAIYIFDYFFKDLDDKQPPIDDEPILQNDLRYVATISPKKPIEFTPDPSVLIIDNLENQLISLRQQLLLTDNDNEKKKLTDIIEWLSLAEDHYKNGEYIDAISYYEKILEIDKNNVYALDRIAFALTRLDRTQESIDYYNQLLETLPNYYVALINKGWSLAMLEQYAEALIEFNKLENQYPDDLLVLAHKCWTLHKLDQHEEALQYCKKVIDANVDDSRVFMAYSLSLSLLEKFEDALSVYEELYQRDETDLPTLVNYANTLSRLGHYDESYKIYLEAYELSEGHPAVLHNLRVLCQNQPQLECEIPQN